MSVHAFKSYRPQNGQQRDWTAQEVVAIARQLLEEHAAAREAATKAANLVCGNCQGSGRMPSTLMPGETLMCFACTGSGKPNEAVQALPDLTEEDRLRMWKIGQLLKGKHRVAVLAVVREYFPEMYRADTEAQPS
jgi:hypothetical protein